MPTISKYLGIITAAVGITLSVFYLMHKLIDGPVVTPDDVDPPVRVVFGPVEIPQEPPRPKPPERPEPPKPQPEKPNIPQKKFDSPKHILEPVDYDVPKVKGSGNDIIMANPRSATNRDGGPERLVAIQPPYPRKAALAGIEGWVKVRFTVTPAGTVTDIHIIEANPDRVFDDAVIRALARWKFEPAMNEGRPVASTVVQMLEFSLDDT